MSKRIWLVAAALVLAMGVAVAPAAADALRMWLVPSQHLGYYGDSASLEPSIDATAAPGDQVEFQIYDATQGWIQYGEAQGVEDTGTIDPLWVVFNQDITFPAQFRAIFRAKASGLTTGPISPVVTLDALKYPVSRLKVTPAKTVYAGKSFTTTIQVHPNPGPGSVSVKTYRKYGARWYAAGSRTVTLDELGTASFKTTVSGRTTYKFNTHFSGNRFGAASSVVAYFTAK